MSKEDECSIIDALCVMCYLGMMRALAVGGNTSKREALTQYLRTWDSMEF